MVREGGREGSKLLSCGSCGKLEGESVRVLALTV